MAAEGPAKGSLQAHAERGSKQSPPQLRVALALAFCSALTWAIIGVLGILLTSLTVSLTTVALITLALVILAVRPQSHQLATNTITVVLSTGLAIVAVDAGIRTVGKTLIYYRVHEQLAAPIPERPYLSRYRPNQSLTFRSYGDLAAMTGDRDFRHYRDVQFQTDKFGFRNPLGASISDLDLIIVGDSFSVGNGTTQEATWPHLLATTQDIKLYNISTAGAGPVQHMLNLEMMLPKLTFAPDAIALLVLFEGNDLTDSSLPPLPLDKAPVVSVQEQLQVRLNTFQRHSGLRQILFRLLNRQKSGTITSVVDTLDPGGIPMYYNCHYADVSRMPPQAVATHPNFKNFERSIWLFKESAQHHGLTPKVVLIPSKYTVYSAAQPPMGMSQVTGAVCANATLPFLDTTDSFAAEAQARLTSDKTLLWWPDDSHFNEQGHALFAQLLDDWISTPSQSISHNSHPDQH